MEHTVVNTVGILHNRFENSEQEQATVIVTEVVNYCYQVFVIFEIRKWV